MKNLFFTISIVLILLNLSIPQEKSDEQLLKRALELKNNGQLEDGLKILNTIISKNNENSKAQNLTGEIYFLMGKKEHLEKADIYFQNALKIEPDNPEYLVDYGNLKLTQKDFRKAEQLFYLAIMENRKFVPAYRGILDYSLQGKQSRYIGLVEKYAGGAASPSVKKELYNLLFKVYTKNNRFDKAIPILDILKEEEIVTASTAFTASQLFYKQADFIESTKCFYEALENLDDENTYKETYLINRDILSAEEKEKLKELTLVGKKGEYMTKLWKAMDPDLVTEENERLIEHFKRIEYAKTFYAAGIEPGYDDRGRVYVKFGPPTVNFLLLGEAHLWYMEMK